MFGYNYKFNLKYSIPPQNLIFWFIELWVLLPVYDIIFDLFLSIMYYSCHIFMCFIILAIHFHRYSCLHFTNYINIYLVSTCFKYYSTQRTYFFFLFAFEHLITDISNTIFEVLHYSVFHQVK